VKRAIRKVMPILLVGIESAVSMNLFISVDRLEIEIWLNPLRVGMVAIIWPVCVRYRI
jgi:hypothetical protein